MKITHNWDAENYKATCIIQNKDNQFIGEAVCHPDDKEYASEITGGYIAEGRAYIKMYQHIKNFELRPQVKILQYTVSAIKSSKYFNPKDFAFIRLEKELAQKKSELEQIKLTIKSETENLRKYLLAKDKLHSRLGKKH